MHTAHCFRHMPSSPSCRPEAFDRAANDARGKHCEKSIGTGRHDTHNDPRRQEVECRGAYDDEGNGELVDQEQMQCVHCWAHAHRDVMLGGTHEKTSRTANQMWQLQLVQAVGGPVTTA